ncbi:DEAD/DEAH box helicase [Glaciimonas immobilis]|uniref:Superfamily II DNA/RNA helicase n=1 Tax=Glaciimonas immobilis TaxID=728004 RepID=A0A840RPG4_9BURK|nr:DEAD/DEAH box helicase [Glaciimonas immobilis]KAF3996828.1 DEAD/DEAH box helicase [Glaciimonas immobilis]MBB5199623.1 superfamily II DNA/RNA helicase [Glaciimonas immobilis]
MPFSLLGLQPSLIRAVSQKGYLTPTAIQEAAIPAILQGHDVVGSAQTGSGKTAAFALPILQLLQDIQTENAPPGRDTRATRPTRALILVPTRELAAQVGESIQTLMQYSGQSLKMKTLFGGVSINPQMMALRGGADIVIATPGRLLDLLDHNALKISAVAMLVLDEADRLLDLGFADEIGRILALLPKHRQNIFFSATFPPAVEALSKKILNNPKRIAIIATETAQPAISQRAIAVDPKRRTQLLVHLLKQNEWDRVLAFVATKYAADYVTEKLHRSGVKAAAFHGEFSQGARTRILAEFKAGELQVLVATDVAARGIDIPQLPVVLNYDLPRSAVDYTHRIGRTGRAGESGIAISFVSADTEAHFRLIEKRHDMRCPREQIAGFEPVETLAADSPSALTASNPWNAALNALNSRDATSENSPDNPVNGGIKGKRKSKKDKLREAATTDPIE